MIKPLLIGVLLSVGAGSAMAQAPGSSLVSESFKQHLRAQYLDSDTAQAIINLYSKRQAGGAGWIVAAALTAVRLAVSGGGSTTTGSGYVVQDNSNSAGAAFLAAVPFMAYGVGKLVHYSNGNLEKTLTAYAAGQHLAPSTQRKLKRRFFNEPIIQYTPVNAAPGK